MGTFLEREKQRLANLKTGAPFFSDAARADGEYKGKPRPFCLPREHSAENLFPPIRRVAIEHFARNGIRWHDGRDGQPSNHLCDSQVCCVNFLFPFADQPLALAEVLRPIFPDIQRMLPIESERFVTFEWIGQHNYLGERVARHGKRTRGANFTSADAAVLFERGDGRRQAVLIEWKYTESYGGTSLRISRNGTDRSKIYEPLYRRADCPIEKSILPGYEALFCEPFYQFMRQQFLAHEMEKAGELGADVVSVLHIAPAHNSDFRKVTSPALAALGETATGVWGRLVRPGDRFRSVSTEQLIGGLTAQPSPQLRNWLEYIQARYPWSMTAA